MWIHLSRKLCEVCMALNIGFSIISILSSQVDLSPSHAYLENNNMSTIFSHDFYDILFCRGRLN